MRYLVFGGDERNIYLYKILKGEGADAALTGFSNHDEWQAENLFDAGEAASAADIIIGPIPFNKGQAINAPFHYKVIDLSYLFSKMHRGQIIIGGRLNQDALKLADKAGVKAFDILEQEEMAVLNAIPTAEGAIQIAMENTITTLHSSRVLIMGYGRIGKILSKMMQGLGADVTVSARKKEDLSMIQAFGHQPVDYTELPDILGQMDIIINTVPCVILNKTNISRLKNKVLVIDLASKPFGIDMMESRRAGINVLFAPSLPGKVAPLSAARYIRETLGNLLREVFENEG